MRAVFTIVAKNYIPLANVLGDSLMRHHPDIAFFIVVADRADGLIQFDQQRYPVIAAEQLGIAQLATMAFTYNVTEFCTALKPFSFRYLFDKGFEEVIYFDPDIYIFDKLTAIYDALQESSMVLTPHYSTVEENYSGLFREGNILFAGIFNLGFCALKRSGNGSRIVSWWSSRLIDQCYADRTDGLHVDQKWADFLPTLFDDVRIERGLGYNMAIWNWHERKLSHQDGRYWVTNRIQGGEAQALVFYHFSNYKFRDADDVQKFVPVNVERMADIMDVSRFYAELLTRENTVAQLAKLAYSYATFDDGQPIAQFHRRFYRRLVENGEAYPNPFTTIGAESYHHHLSKNGLLGNNRNLDKLNEVNFDGFDRKLRMLNRVARLVKTIIGFDRYALLCKFMFRYVRSENQAFLLKEHASNLPFVNENRYVNLK
ncbi:hypothetical protein [Spirosoma arcticum]